MLANFAGYLEEKLLAVVFPLLSVDGTSGREEVKLKILASKRMPD